MSDYARRHHPQVQARRDPNALTLNAYTRNRLVEALEHFDHADARRLSKVDAWKRLRNDQRAIAWLKESNAWLKESN